MAAPRAPPRSLWVVLAVLAALALAFPAPTRAAAVPEPLLASRSPPGAPLAARDPAAHVNTHTSRCLPHGGARHAVRCAVRIDYAHEYRFRLSSASGGAERRTATLTAWDSVCGTPGEEFHKEDFVEDPQSIPPREMPGINWWGARCFEVYVDHCIGASCSDVFAYPGEEWVLEVKAYCNDQSKRVGKSCWLLT